MSHDYGVTEGHSPYSLHRYREDVKHMVIFDDLVEHEHHRVRLYLSDAAYQLLKQEAAAGVLKIVHHEEMIEGTFTPETQRTRKAHKRKSK